MVFDIQLTLILPDITPLTDRLPVTVAAPPTVNVPVALIFEVVSKLPVVTMFPDFIAVPLTFEAVVIVASLLSAIAAVAEISAFTIPEIVALET